AASSSGMHSSFPVQTFVSEHTHRMIETERQGDVSVIRLAHGKVNAIDLELAEAVTDAVQAAGVAGAKAGVLTGTGTAFSAAVQLGLADELAADDAVLDRAVAVAERLAAVPAPTYRLTKLQLRQAVFEGIDRNAPVNDPLVIDGWSSPETIARLQASMERR